MSKFIPMLNLILFGLMGCAHLMLSGDFWNQLPTFFWEQTKVVVTSNELKDSPGKRGPMGTVHFKILGDDSSSTFSDHLSERYDFGDASAKTTSFIAAYTAGSVHTGYIAPDRSRVSLGHFPREHGYSFFLTGSLFVIGALVSWRRLRAIVREDRAGPETATIQPHP